MKTAKRLIRLSEFRTRAYAGTPPCLPTLRAHCERGLLPAERIGNRWWVDMAAYERGEYGADAAVQAVVAAVLGAA